MAGTIMGVIMGNNSKYLIAIFYVLVRMMILLLEPKKNQMVKAADATYYVVPNFCVTRSTHLQDPYNDIPKFICSSLDWHGYDIAFHQDQDNVVTIVLSGIYEKNWIGIGVSQNGEMVGSSAVVGWLRGNDSNSSVIKQYSLEDQFKEQCKPDKGDLQFAKAAPIMVLKEKVIYLAFQLQFPHPLAYQPFIFAAGLGKPGNDNILPKHKFKTSMAVDFSRGTFTLGYVDSRKVKMNHGILGIIGWGIIIPLGVALARYLREYEPLWYYLHSSVQFVGFFVGLATVAVGKSLYDQIHADFSSHRAIGYIVLSLSVLQVCQFVVRPSRSSKVRYYWNLSHYWVGRVTILLGPLNILIGLYMGNGDERLKMTFLCVLVVFIVAELYLEIRLLMKRKREPTTKLNEPIPVAKPYFEM